MALCTVTGAVYLPSGELARSTMIKFTRVDKSVNAEYLGAVVPADVYTKTDRLGQVDFEILTGRYIMHVAEYSGGAVVPDALTADIADVLTIITPSVPVPAWLTQALAARDAASASADAAAASADDAATSAGQAAFVLSRGVVDARDYGVDLTGASDTTDTMQLFLNACEGREGFIPEGIYRINGSLTLPSNARIYGVLGNDAGTEGTTLRQFGQVLFNQPDGLANLDFSRVTFDRRTASPTARTVLFALRQHMRCKFTDYRMIRYDDCTIMERLPSAAATANTIDNEYRNWFVSACMNLDIGIGREGYYYVHEGNGTAATISTGIAWPEQNPGSVVVLLENATRRFSEFTGYTVSFPGGALTVTLTAPLAAGQRLHIWPSQPRTDGARRPLSNNLWENIRVDYCFGTAHAAPRWVDAETFRFERILLSANGAKCYHFNPYVSRGGQGGDYAAFEDCILSPRSEFGLDMTTLSAFDFGPGSICMSGRGIRMDFAWLVAGVNYGLTYRDRRRVALTGTITAASGQPVITGTGTDFTRELTLVGTNKDLVEIGGVIRAISSIDSPTQITLTSNLAAAVTDATMHRINVENGCDARMDYASMGDGFYSNRSWQSGLVVINSLTERSGSAVIPSGATSVTVTHGLRRAPRPGELFLLAHSGLNGRTLSVSSVGANSFIINVNTAAAADYTIGWSAKLMELN